MKLSGSFNGTLTSLLLWTAVFLGGHNLLAQSVLDGSFSGNLEMRTNVFLADEEIGAGNTPQYDNQLSGTEAWLNLIYSAPGFDMGVRFDLFNNSNLLNPTGSYTDQGIGRWYIHKEIHNLNITGGYIYDQIGSGIIYRAYEERPLLIDNALYGIRLVYDLGENWRIKAFGGKQKFLFETYGTVLKGGSLEGYIRGKEGSRFSMAPGIGMVNRTFSDPVINALVDELTFYTPEDREEVELRYNTYAFTLYNTLVAGPVTWYLEGAYKTETPIDDPFEERHLGTGATVLGQLVSEPGSVIYSSVSFAKSGWGITLEGKRTDYFRFRTDPKLVENDGQINFLPPMSRQNAYRLTSRYAPATQELGELAIQADIKYSPNRKWAFTLNAANIENLDGDLLYRELFTEVRYKYKRKWILTGGLQLQEYNQDVFEGKPGVPNVETVVPYLEYLYKFTPRKSLRMELQYMHTAQDYGSWIFALAEFGMAPHWIFSVSDMYNIDPLKTGKLHYPTVGVVYNHRSNRFTLSYVKQVEGVVCTGGICRLEPAFSGFRLTLNSTF